MEYLPAILSPVNLAQCLEDFNCSLAARVATYAERRW
jgi:hypothetical protein